MAAELVDAYLAGLKAKWDEVGGEESAQDFSLTQGATEADLARLRAAYPLCPDALIDLLRRVDGTYHRDYEGNSVAIYLLGGRDRGTARATLGQGLAVSAFPLCV